MPASTTGPRPRVPCGSTRRCSPERPARRRRKKSMASLLAVRDVHKRFATASQPVEVLRGISFELEEGEALAVTGPSGSGKSTLLHLIGSLDRPSSGTIEIGDADPFRLPEPELAWFRNRTIGFVFQDSHLLPKYTLLENVLVPALAFPGRGMDARTAEARARDLLARVG